jgi:acyl-CoA synthetase (AMP-forming)/AMP-acid ligase II
MAEAIALTSYGLARAPHRMAIVSADGGYSYEELECEIQRCERHLAQRGFVEGHRIAIQLPTSPLLLVLTLAALRKRISVALLPTRLSHAATRARMADIVPDAFIGSGDDFAKLSSPEAAPGDPLCALLLCTSGTSGTPSVVVLDMSSVLWNARANATALGLEPNDRAIVQLDCAYCYALVHQVFSHLIVGGSVALARHPPRLECLENDCRRMAANTLALVPSMLRAVLRAGSQIDRLRLLTVGGAPIREDLLADAAQRFRNTEIVVTYGLTEAGPRVCTRWYGGLRSDEGLVGRPLPGVVVTTDSAGEIIVASPSNRSGYLRRGVFVAESQDLRTGDRGWIDVEGNVYLTGRVRPMICRGGLKIAPSEIERVLKGHPRVRDVRVASMPDARLGEVPCAYVVATDPVPSADLLGQMCLAELGAEWIPRTISFVAQLPSSEDWKG